jgi:hypothetical protein
MSGQERSSKTCVHSSNWRRSHSLRSTLDNIASRLSEVGTCELAFKDGFFETIPINAKTDSG